MPNPSLSTAFAIKGQAFNLSGVLRSQSNGNPIATGLSGLAAWVSKDDGAFAAATNTPVERNASGWVSLDLTAAEMTASKVDVMFTATGAVTDCRLIAPLDVSPITGRFDAQPSPRFEQAIMDLHAYLINQNVFSGARQEIGNADGSLRFAGTMTEGDDASATKGKLA